MRTAPHSCSNNFLLGSACVELGMDLLIRRPLAQWAPGARERWLERTAPYRSIIADDSESEGEREGEIISPAELGNAASVSNISGDAGKGGCGGNDCTTKAVDMLRGASGLAGAQRTTPMEGQIDWQPGGAVLEQLEERECQEGLKGKSRRRREGEGGEVGLLCNCRNSQVLLRSPFVPSTPASERSRFRASAACAASVGALSHCGQRRLPRGY